VWETEAEPILEEARVAIRASIADAVAAAEDETIDIETMRRHVRRALGRVISQRTRRRPAIIPVVMEV
jgi:ribonuclease J